MQSPEPKPTVKTKFVDFWVDNSKAESFFLDLMRPNFNVCIDDNPDILFFSRFGDRHRSYS